MRPSASGWRARTRRASRGVMRWPRAFTNRAGVGSSEQRRRGRVARRRATASQAGRAERQPADLGALAEHGDRRLAQVDGVDVEAAALAHAQARAVEELEQRERRAMRASDRRRRPPSAARSSSAIGVVAARARAAASSGRVRCGGAPRRRARRRRGGAGSARTRAPTRPCARSTPSRTRASAGTRSSAAARGGRGRTRPCSRRVRTTRRTRRRRACTRGACARSRR